MCQMICTDICTYGGMSLIPTVISTILQAGHSGKQVRTTKLECIIFATYVTWPEPYVHCSFQEIPVLNIQSIVTYPCFIVAV